MARRRTGNPSRCEVTTTVEKHKTDMREQGESVEKPVRDLETERDTIEQLEGGGTAEGSDEVFEDMERSRDVSGTEFQQETEQLERIQDETEQYEQELDGRSEVASSDREKIITAEGGLHSGLAQNELAAAEASTRRDIEFLDHSEQEAQDMRIEVITQQAERKGRADAAGR